MFDLVGKRYQQLYKLAKVNKKKENTNNDNEAYSFSPNLVKRINTKESSPIDSRTLAVIERLKKAREERERVRKGTERDIDNSGMRFDLEHNKFKNTNSSRNKTLMKAPYKYETYTSPKREYNTEHTPIKERNDSKGNRRVHETEVESTLIKKIMTSKGAGR